MRSIAVAVAVVLASAAPAVAQTPDPAPEPAPPRWTAGVSVIHHLFAEDGEPPLGVHVGWRMSDRVSFQADVVQLRESYGYDEYFGGERIRTIRWWMGGALYHFTGRGPIQPHLLAGGEMMIDTTLGGSVIFSKPMGVPALVGPASTHLVVPRGENLPPIPPHTIATPHLWRAVPRRLVNA